MYKQDKDGFGIPISLVAVRLLNNSVSKKIFHVMFLGLLQIRVESQKTNSILRSASAAEDSATPCQPDSTLCEIRSRTYLNGRSKIQ